MEYDQFQMEQLIMNCWNVTEDIDMLFEEVVEGEPTIDNIANILLGLKELYDIRFQKLFRMFEASIKLTTPDEVVKSFNHKIEKVPSFKEHMDSLKNDEVTFEDSDPCL